MAMRKRKANDDPKPSKKKPKPVAETKISSIDPLATAVEVAFPVSDETLPLLLSTISGCKFLRFFESITGQQLVMISELLPELETLEIMPCRWVKGDPDAIDLEDDELGSFCFPNLKKLLFISKGLRTIHFMKENFPKLEILHLEQPCLYSHREFHLDLPELVELIMYDVHVKDTSDFGPSLSRSPKLKKLKTFKFWGLGHYNNTHIVRCPNMEHFELYRADDLKKLTVHSAVLTELNLRSSYAIRAINVFPKNGTKYKLNIKNVCSDDDCRPPFFGEIKGNFAGSRCDLENSVYLEHHDDLEKEQWQDWFSKKWNLVMYNIPPNVCADHYYHGKDSSGKKLIIRKVYHTDMTHETAEAFAYRILEECNWFSFS